MKKWILASVSLALMASAGVAQERQRLGVECRKEVRALCVPGGGRPERGAIKSCLKDKATQLSQGCRAELKARKELRQQSKADKLKSEDSQR
jgi:arylformamidase